MAFFEALRRSRDHTHDGLLSFYFAVHRTTGVTIGTAYARPSGERIPLESLRVQLRHLCIMGKRAARLIGHAAKLAHLMWQVSQGGGDAIVYRPGDIILSAAGDLDKGNIEVVAVFGLEIRVDDLADRFGGVAKVAVGGSGPDLIAGFAAMGSGDGDRAGVGKRK